MWSEIRQGARFSVITAVLFGGVYHLALWGVGQAAFAPQAEGSLVRRSDGSIAGSRLIAQEFDRPEYFRARPSGVDYDAAATGGTNDGPSIPHPLFLRRDGAIRPGPAVRLWRRGG
jgi:K+-transporting ATPase ATPase C chain